MIQFLRAMDTFRLRYKNKRMPSREVITVSYETEVKHKYICGHKVEFLNIRPNDMQSNH